MNKCNNCEYSRPHCGKCLAGDHYRKSRQGEVNDVEMLRARLSIQQSRIEELERQNKKYLEVNGRLHEDLQDYQFNYDSIKELTKENAELKLQLEKITKDRDSWKQRAIDTYGEC